MKAINYFQWGYKTGLIYQTSRLKFLTRLLLSMRYSNNMKYFHDDYLFNINERNHNQ